MSISGFLGFRGENLLGDAVAIHRRREPTINSHLAQDRGQLLRREPITQGAAKVRLEFVHAAKTGDHPEIEQAAVAWLQVLVSPYRSPAKLIEQILEFAVEVIGIGDGAINVFISQYLAAHRHATVVKCLVHWISPFIRQPVPYQPMLTEGRRFRPFERKRFI